MSTHKYIDRICIIVLVISMVATLLFMNGKAFGITAQATTGYESRLFDTSRVHQIDIVMDDWDGFLETCENEEYTACAVVIDGESYKNIGIRAKGNTSLSNVSQMGSDRYSLKIEFDHYNSAETYYGLDKLRLNNIIQDNTYMKDYLSYQLMREAGRMAILPATMVKTAVEKMEWRGAAQMSNCNISMTIRTAILIFLIMPRQMFQRQIKNV